MAHLPLGNNLTASDVVIINRFVWNVISHDVRIIDHNSLPTYFNNDDS